MTPAHGTPAHVQLRLATAADLAAILSLDRATEGAPHWPSAAYTAILEPPKPSDSPVSGPLRCLFVAETVLPTTDLDAATLPIPIAGFAVGLVLPSPALPSPAMPPADTIAELESVAVAVSVRRRGVGRALCAAVLDWCREHGATSIILEVRAHSAPAIALYTQLGFLHAGRRPRYYRDPDDDALILRFQLRRSEPEEATP
jgi:[ribosomal protein S18]-alanine N-acetyltransferase